MPRKALGPRLYLRKDKDGGKVWIIRDNNRDTRTGCKEDEKLGAMRALAEYKQGRPIMPRQKIGNGVVYFVTCVGSPNYPIKIGWTTKALLVRVAQLQYGNPNILQAVASFPGTYDDERSLHIVFAHLHIRGEWFYRTDELIDYIQEINPNEQAWGVEEFKRSDDGVLMRAHGLNSTNHHQP